MFEIYFNDLKPEVQDELLAYMGISNADELNWDIMPLMVIGNNILGNVNVDEIADAKETQTFVENFKYSK